MAQVTRDLPEADWISFEAAAAERYRRAGLAWPGVVVRVRSPMAGALAAPIAAEVLSGRRSAESPARLRDRMDDCLSLNLRLTVGGPADEAITVAVRQAVGLDRVPAPPSPQPLTELFDGRRTAWDDFDVMPYALVGVVAAGAIFLGGVLGWFPFVIYGGRWAALFALAAVVVGITVGFVVRMCSLAVRVALCRRPRFLARAVGGGDFRRDNVTEAVERGIRWAVEPAMRPKFRLRDQFLLSPGEKPLAGWWWPHERFVMVSDLPRVLEADRLAWSDGWHCPARQSDQPRA